MRSFDDIAKSTYKVKAWLEKSEHDSMRHSHSIEEPLPIDIVAEEVENIEQRSEEQRKKKPKIFSMLQQHQPSTSSRKAILDRRDWQQMPATLTNVIFERKPMAVAKKQDILSTANIYNPTVFIKKELEAEPASASKPIQNSTVDSKRVVFAFTASQIGKHSKEFDEVFGSEMRTPRNALESSWPSTSSTNRKTASKLRSIKNLEKQKNSNPLPRIGLSNTPQEREFEKLRERILEEDKQTRIDDSKPKKSKKIDPSKPPRVGKEHKVRFQLDPVIGKHRESSSDRKSKPKSKDKAKKSKSKSPKRFKNIISTVPLKIPGSGPTQRIRLQPTPPITDLTTRYSARTIVKEYQKIVDKLHPTVPGFDKLNPPKDPRLLSAVTKDIIQLIPYTFTNRSETQFIPTNPGKYPNYGLGLGLGLRGISNDNRPDTLTLIKDLDSRKWNMDEVTGRENEPEKISRLPNERDEFQNVPLQDAKHLLLLEKMDIERRLSNVIRHMDSMEDRSKK